MGSLSVRKNSSARLASWEVMEASDIAYNFDYTSSRLYSCALKYRYVSTASFDVTILNL